MLINVLFLESLAVRVDEHALFLGIFSIALKREWLRYIFLAINVIPVFVREPDC